MLDEAFNKEQFLTEGKHWPEDYIKTGINLVKASQLGQQSWYIDSYIQQDIKTFASEFGPLSHKNSNLGFFSTIVKWFIAYSGSSKEKYQEFIERKLDGIIGTLQTILNDPAYDKIKDEIKQKWTLEQFEQLQKKIADEAKASSDEKLKSIQKRDDYEVIPIYSYEELHEKFGGSWTGYKGQSEWCHTNGKSTYESWTKDGTQMFFVLAKKGWKKVFQPEQKPTGKDYNAYDEYGLSLIAILVDVKTGSLLNETLRWNHVVEPSHTNPGASVDKAFKNNWGALSQAVGMDVKSICEKECKNLKAKLENIIKNANNEVEKILSEVNEIKENTILENVKKYITSIVIPSNVTSIGNYAFSHCTSLRNVTIPNSVTSIGYGAFSHCTSLKSVSIPDSVTSIGDETFSWCIGLTSITIPDSVMSIGETAFSNCSRLTSVTIPDGVTSIRDRAFYNCSRLSSVSIPDSVTSIGDGVFSNCRRLKSMTIGNSVEYLGSNIFFNCINFASVTIPNSVMNIGRFAFNQCNGLKKVVFKGKTLAEVKAMKYYPWAIDDESIIKCEDHLNENKAAYLQKYRDESDVKSIVDMFWSIRSRLQPPLNDIDWWIKKPFADLRNFVQTHDFSNKRSRRDAEWRSEALQNDAKMLGERDGYEIWYVPTYESMKILGRFYKGRSAKWCVASDDPDWWFDHHDEDEYVLLIREDPLNDEFDKVAIQMENRGRHFTEDNIIPWDLENNDWTFDRGVVEDAPELMRYAWELFRENGELREHYY